MTRRQCAKCPWKVSTDPHEIPHGYSEAMHRALAGTIRSGPGSMSGGLRVMACHETPPGNEKPCAGWLANQLGPGNNLGLRLAAARGQIDVDYELEGPQHERFEDTLPRRREGSKTERTP